MKRLFKWLNLLFAVFLAYIIVASLYFSLTPISVIYKSGRIAADYIFLYLKQDDVTIANNITRNYYFGFSSENDPQSGWELIDKAYPVFKLKKYSQFASIVKDIPFVYIQPTEPQLVKLKNEYDLEGVIRNGRTEFEKMLLLAKWLGTRWDHGKDKPPGSPKTIAFDPIKVIAAGENGRKFWCEIAAEVAVLTASAMGWPARLVTLSKDGYKWEHSVAEFWSNQYKKWFVVDTDFNVIFENEKIPLSAFELCHYLNKFETSQTFKIIRIAPPKPSLANRDFSTLLSLFKYVHIDLRNDWIVRQLTRGSPAAGDLATWWTARPTLGPILTGKIRVDDINRYNWPVNVCEVHAISLDYRNGSYFLKIGMGGYSPYFKKWIIRVDNGAPIIIDSNFHVLQLTKGKHSISVSMKLLNDNIGPATTVNFVLK